MRRHVLPQPPVHSKVHKIERSASRECVCVCWLCRDSLGVDRSGDRNLEREIEGMVGKTRTVADYD